MPMWAAIGESAEMQGTFWKLLHPAGMGRSLHIILHIMMAADAPICSGEHVCEEAHYVCDDSGF